MKRITGTCTLAHFLKTRAQLVIGLIVSAQSGLAAAPQCERLTTLMIPNTTVISASPSARASQNFCLATAVVRPVADSEIRVEIWLPPAEEWNGKFLGTGNGGYSGTLSYGEMEAALRKGYATAGSDTGHSGGDLRFGLGHPEKIQDWGHRAVHVMTETAKLLVHVYYGHFPSYSYFSGCSTGGHQALMEAQRYPEDYDGILAGAPGNNRVRLNVGFLWSWMTLRKAPGDPLPPSKLPLLNRAAIAACDAMDGVKDGLIGDPARCRFDPGTLVCRGADAPDCLTADQVAAVRLIYEGARNPRTHEQLFTGWARGTEAGWASYFVGRPEPARVDFWRYWVFYDPAWDPLTFDFDRDVAYADTRMSFLTANSPDLRDFQKRNGKLLVYHGWADPVAPPEESIRYYESVSRIMGGYAKLAPFYRLFLAPGMGHCSGGPGPNSFDGLGALDQWVTRSVAPDRIIASHSTGGKVDRTRPLCPYPLIARWKGTGNSDEAAEFVCAVPAAPARK
ncbi:MAG TPA: tannase/feruloyl esterase family alpha/beta hydrolase [Paludibaculum sp.]|jgi:feruloyl esterase